MNGNKTKMGNVARATAGAAGLLVLAGCSGASQPADSSEPAAVSSASVATTPTKTTGQVASAVASTKKRLDSTISRYNASSCDVIIERGPTGLDKASCVADKGSIATLSSAMAITLESQKPWPTEVDALATRTVNRLRSTAAAAEGDLSSNMFHDNVLFLGQDLDAWAPFGV